MNNHISPLRISYKEASEKSKQFGFGVMDKARDACF